MNNKIQYIKLDMDDILEILIEHYYDQLDNINEAKGIILGTPDTELRFVGAFCNNEETTISNIDLEKIDEEIKYNGDHSFLKKNTQFYL